MGEQGGSETVGGVLEPTLPLDLGARAQRRRIIAAMIASVAEKTYSGTTISDIVAGASISRTTFYKRFADKRACFDAALQHCVERLRARAAAAIEPGDPPPLAIRRATAATLQMLAAEPELAQLVMGEAVNVEPATFGRYRDQLVPEVRALWEAGGGGATAHADPRLAIGRAQVLIFDKVAAGEAAALPQLLPDLVYLILLPFGGHETALEQSRLAAAEAGGGG